MKKRGPTPPLTPEQMRGNYQRQNGSTRLTLRQERAIRRKQRRLAK